MKVNEDDIDYVGDYNSYDDNDVVLIFLDNDHDDDKKRSYDDNDDDSNKINNYEDSNNKILLCYANK